MGQLEDYIIEIIGKQLNGTATAAELDQLEQWLNKDPLLNHEEYNTYKRLWVETGELADNLVFDSQAAWKKLDSRIQQKAAARKQGIFHLARTRWMVAAAVLLAVVAATWLLVSRQATTDLTITASTDNQAIRLGDGSTVTLRKGATLVYPAAFSSGARKLQLNGDAFFVVEKNSRSAFIVTTANAEIKVLGTSFFVHATADSADVFVNSGRIRFTNKNQKSSFVELNANEAATLIMNRLEKKTVKNANYIAWQTGILDFNDEPLDQVVQDLNDYYADSVVLSPELDTVAASIAVNAHFNKEPLDEVLKEITLATQIHSRRESNRIILYK